jgi:hypothetical protein
MLHEEDRLSRDEIFREAAEFLDNVRLEDR